MSIRFKTYWFNLLGQIRLHLILKVTVAMDSPSLQTPKWLKHCLVALEARMLSWELSRKPSHESSGPWLSMKSWWIKWGSHLHGYLCNHSNMMVYTWWDQIAMAIDDVLVEPSLYNWCMIVNKVEIVEIIYDVKKFHMFGPRLTSLSF